MNLHRLICGDARRLPIADASIHCMITSPPYWGLRDYGNKPSVWGGDPACEHECATSLRPSQDSSPSSASTLRGNGHVGGGPKLHADRPATKTGFCVKCGAWLGCYGLEPTPDLYVEHTVEIFREWRRVLRADGTLWLNLGDSYSTGTKAERPATTISGPSVPAGWSNRNQNVRCGTPHGLKTKDLIGIPWRVAFALQADGWYLRDCIIWAKPNPMPSSVTDRTTTAHEYVFLLTKSARYFYDADAIREPITSTGGACVGKQKISAEGTGAQSRKFADPSERNNPLGRNKRSVWTIPTHAFPGAHFATFPPRLVEPMIRAGTSEKGCCPKCAAPWRRVVERVPTGAMQKMADGWDTGSGGHGTIHRDGREPGKSGVPVMANVTVAWTPTCKCDAGDPVPCTVGDFFVGSGTTIMVAAKLGRRGVGIDTSENYLATIARPRIAEELSRPAHKPKSRRKRQPKGEPDLFTLTKGAA